MVLEESDSVKTCLDFNGNWIEVPGTEHSIFSSVSAGTNV